MKKRSPKPGLLFVVSGPSGSGKTTLALNLLKQARLRGKVIKSISFTTRKKRSGERQNKDYFFISEPEFRRLLKAKKILEWTRYLGYYYGTPKDFIDRQLGQGKNILLCLDLKGAMLLKRYYPRQTVTIFVVPPSLKELRARIAGRCHQTVQEEVRRRLKLAKRELRCTKKYDYCLANKNFTQALKRLQGIVLKKIDQHREE